MRKATAVVIAHISIMLFANNMKLNALINKIVEFIKDFKLPVRKNRSFERHFNTSKHSVNYKRNSSLCLS